MENWWTTLVANSVLLLALLIVSGRAFLQIPVFVYIIEEMEARNLLYLLNTAMTTSFWIVHVVLYIVYYAYPLHLCVFKFVE